MTEMFVFDVIATLRPLSGSDSTKNKTWIFRDYVAYHDGAANVAVDAGTVQVASAQVFVNSSNVTVTTSTTNLLVNLVSGTEEPREWRVVLVLYGGY